MSDNEAALDSKDKIVTIECDNCGYEWRAGETLLKETPLELGGVSYVFSYFSCPMCNKVFRVALKDEKYMKLQKNLEIARLRVRSYQGKGLRYKSTVENLVKRAMKAADVLKKHVDRTNLRYDGVFTLQHDKDGKDVISYLPQGYNAE